MIYVSRGNQSDIFKDHIFCAICAHHLQSYSIYVGISVKSNNGNGNVNGIVNGINSEILFLKSFIHIIRM